ncbi:MAG: glycine cleavage T C-terminal barrel domain-containing protein [Planctomycetota bacterium]
MAHQTPLRDRLAQAEATLRHYGPIESQVELVETFGELDFEYAALRKACVVIDQPHRGTIEIVGEDAIDFLNNMITQELKPGGSVLPALKPVRSFWLSRKGRITSDMRLTRIENGTPRLLVDLDVHAVEPTMASLNEYIITEDVELRDATDRMHRLALHGPTGPLLLAEVGEVVEGPPPTDLTDRSATVLTIAGHEVIVERCDTAGVCGLELTMATDAVVDVYGKLVEVGEPVEGQREDAPASKIKLRPAGWLAYNTARIEAGEPLFNLDFGPDSLPGETGQATLSDRVSFTKGCYLGQEVVARMQNLGKPKQVLMGLKPHGENLTADDGFPRQPMGGTHVFSTADPDGDPIGIVSSSTISPMLGGAAIAFAIVKSKLAEDGAEVIVPAEGARLTAKLRSDLSFVS